ncbi:hypothetical protein [Nocardia arthritidis]|uniref:hypothetical protein n=1 Tax=Nocardia arthritidis TaxID=228602 RepID=UPI0007A4EF7B|nr:hypothetical protein [Nocardia arthritidis]
MKSARPRRCDTRPAIPSGEPDADKPVQRMARFLSKDVQVTGVRSAALTATTGISRRYRWAGLRDGTPHHDKGGALPAWRRSFSATVTP